NTEEPVVVGIAQICLRETAGNDERNSFGLEAGDSLLATRSSTKVESADNHVATMCAKRELRVVIFHHDARHHLGRHVVAVRIVLAIDRVGVDVIRGHEYEATANVLRKSGKNFDALTRRRIGGEILETGAQRTRGESPRSGNVTGNRRGGDNFGTCQVAL